MKFSLCILFMICSSYLYSQDISSTEITWKIDQGNDLEAKKNFPYNSLFKTNSSGTIQWHQGNSTYNKTFQIVSSEGSWTDVSKRGKVRYIVRDDSGDAELIFERTSSGISISLDILPSGPEYKFHVVEISVE